MVCASTVVNAADADRVCVCGTAWLCALHMAMRDPLRPPAGGHCPFRACSTARARMTAAPAAMTATWATNRAAICCTTTDRALPARAQTRATALPDRPCRHPPRCYPPHHQPAALPPVALSALKAVDASRTAGRNLYENENRTRRVTRCALLYNHTGYS